MDGPSVANTAGQRLHRVAALILVLVISGWGIRPASTTMAGNAAPATSGHHQAPPAAKFDPVRTNAGKCRPGRSPARTYLHGNPDTEVWVDVHTALYHCPGSDLYGKTPDGKQSTQREAQQDQFEPANRKACRRLDLSGLVTRRISWYLPALSCPENQCPSRVRNRKLDRDSDQT